MLKSLFGLFLFAASPSVFAKSDGSHLLPPHFRVIPLSEAAHARVDAYFTDLYRRLDLPGEENKPVPRLVLVRADEETVAFVNPASDDFIFWNVDFFMRSSSVDLDLYVLAHERRHLMGANKAVRETRAKEYDADIHAIGVRLFRHKIRDPKTKEPQKALVAPKALIDYLSGQTYRDDYFHGKSAAAAIKVAFGKELTRRDFPQAPTPRTHLEPLFEEIRNTAGDITPFKVASPSSSETEDKIETANERLAGDLIAAFAKTDERFAKIAKADRDNVDFPFVAEFVKTKAWLDEKVLKGLSGEEFDAFAKLRPNLFTDWFDVALEHASGLRQAGIDPHFFMFGPLDFVVNLQLEEDRVGVNALREFFAKSIFRLDRLTTFYSTSRLLQYVIDAKAVDKLRARPTTALLVVLFAELARNEISTGSSELLARFEREVREPLARAVTAPRALAKIVDFIKDAKDPRRIATEFAFLMLRLDLDRALPGFREELAQLLPREPEFATLHFVLAGDARNASTELRGLIDRGQDKTFVTVLNAFYDSTNSSLTRKEARELARSYLARRTTDPGNVYFRGLAEFVSIATESRRLLDADTMEDLLRTMQSIESSSELQELRVHLSARVALDPARFLRGWGEDLSPYHYILGPLVAWEAIFARADVTQLSRILLEGRPIFERKEFGYAPVQNALVNRISAMIKEEPMPSDALFRIATQILNQLSTTTPESQRLLVLLVERLKADESTGGPSRLLDFLHAVNITNFTDTDAFVELYASSFIRQFTSHVLRFRDRPLNKLSDRLKRIKTSLEPLVAQKILLRLAEAYGADLTQKAEFSVTANDHAESLPTVVDDFHVWNEVFRNMSREQITNILACLRENVRLRPEIAAEIALRLAQSKILVRAEAVETYLHHRFQMLAPFERAGVFQLMLDGATSLLDDKEFRSDIFKGVLANIPDAKVRRIFLDIWEAGMEALPAELRSLVLSIVLSESGKVGSPEKALVTLLSHMGPLEQKFGQVLAFTDLPEAYRAELRTLWDGAQSMDWWEAWELIGVQIGDITKQGYRLSRILNSGSTVAYLEITNGEKRYVVPVFRDGVKVSVSVGSKQLRIFARELVKKDPVRYGFLPLLVEDSIRTMKNELDGGYKRRMTKAMRKAYRDAALRLGWEVDGRGVIRVDGFSFDTIGTKRFTTGEGESFVAQELADGEPLRLLEPRDAEKYRAITRLLLRLEQEVLKDPSAPVDKDRMPGQNIFSSVQNLNYILDHGQAAFLDEKVHSRFIEFTRRAFAVDVEWLSRALFEITGVKPDVTNVVPRLRQSETGQRPLVFLSEVASQYLRYEDGDPRRELFFELLHGVRAQLRLLQWEQSAGLSDLSDQVKTNLVQTKGIGSLAVSEAMNRMGQWFKSMRKGASDLAFEDSRFVSRMEEAYMKGCEPNLTETGSGN